MTERGDHYNLLKDITNYRQTLTQRYDIIHALWTEPPLAPSNERFERPCSFITSKTSHDLLSFLISFILFSTKLLNFFPPSAWASIPTTFAFPSKDFSSILSLLFLSSRALSGRNGTLCVKKRGSESIIKARRLHAQRRMVSPSSVCAEHHS